MATIPRGLSSSRPSCSLKPLRNPQRRSISTSHPRCAASQGQAMSQGNMMRNMPKQQSMAARMKKLRRSEIPNDIGLIPNTFVRPCGRMPSWVSQPLLRTRLEWLSFKQGFLDFTATVYLKRWTQPKDPMTGKRKKLPLELRGRYETARELHEQLYKAIAERDRSALEKMACSGLVNQQISRFDKARIADAPEESWTVKYRGWTVPSRLVFTLQLLIPSYLKSVHILADRIINLPVGPGVLLRQVVVRIDSTQTLDRNDGSTPTTKKLREYVVIQKAAVEGDEEDWRVWGTINPSTVEEAMDIIKVGKSENGSIMDRLRTMVPGLM